MFKTNLLFTSISILASIGIIYFVTMIGQLRDPLEILLFTDDLICYAQSCKEDDLFLSKQNNISELIPHLDIEQGLIRYSQYNIRYWHSYVDINNLVLEIRDTSDMGLMQLGDLVSFFGTPCSLTIAEEAVYVQFDNFFVELLASYDLTNSETLNLFLSPRMLVDKVIIYSNPISCAKPLIFPTSHNFGSKWHGFNTLSFYISIYHKLQGQ